jgi:hypothetical protein
VNKKPPELPNIEDATLRACLAPLMDAMNSGGELASQALAPAPVAPAPVVSAARQRSRSPGSNDNPPPPADNIGPADREPAGTPATLAEWRLQADDDFAAFRMAELFLAMTDAELAAAAAEFPRQIAGTLARIGRIKQRLAAQYDRMTATVALLERARLQVPHDAETG